MRQIQKEHTQEIVLIETEEELTFALLDMLSDEDDIKVNWVLIMKRKEASVTVDHL